MLAPWQWSRSNVPVLMQITWATLVLLNDLNRFQQRGFLVYWEKLFAYYKRLCFLNLSPIFSHSTYLCGSTHLALFIKRTKKQKNGFFFIFPLDKISIYSV